MLRNSLIFIILILFFFSCGDDSGTNNGNSDSLWIYYNFRPDNDQPFVIERMDLQTGKRYEIIDSAELASLPVNNRLIFKRYDEEEDSQGHKTGTNQLWVSAADGKNRQLLIEKEYDQNQFEAWMLNDGNTAVLLSNKELSVIGIDDGSEEKISNTPSYLNIHYMAIAPDGSGGAFFSNNCLYIVDHEAKTLREIDIPDCNLDSFFSYDQQGKNIIGKINGNETNTLVKINLESADIDTIGTGKSFNRPYLLANGEIIFNELEPNAQYRNYFYNVWVIKPGSTVPQILSPKEGNGYRHIYHKEFVGNDEILLGKIRPYSAHYYDKIYACNIYTGELRFLCDVNLI